MRERPAMLNLKHINLRDNNVASFALKRDAIAFAKAQGWRSGDVIKASNRFSIFWVVYQGFGDYSRLMRRDGSLFDPCAQDTEARPMCPR